MSNYRHKINDKCAPLPLGKIICVGRNFSEHISELGNCFPESPVLFLKPSTSLVELNGQLKIDSSFGACHFETELALLIGKELKNCSEDEAMKAIIGIGLSLDLTYRDLQNKLKSEGLPWEKSKGFDGSCPTTNFISPNHFTNLNNIQFKLFINGKERQRGDTSAMIFRIDEILCYASKYFSILPGDLVLTGTPFGVGALTSNDELRLEIPNLLNASAKVSFFKGKQ